MSVISAPRTHAISGRDWRLTAAVSSLLLLRVAYDIFIAVTTISVPIPEPLSGCASGPRPSPVIKLFYIAAMSASIGADAVVFIVIWHRTYHMTRLARRENIEASLSALILRDGAIYFVLLLIMNSFGLATYVLEYFNGIAFLITASSTIILSHLLLNLRKASLSASDGASSAPPTNPSDIDFSPRPDVFGATLSISWVDGVDQDAEDGDDGPGDVGIGELSAELREENGEEQAGISEEPRDAAH